MPLSLVVSSRLLESGTQQEKEVKLEGVLCTLRPETFSRDSHVLDWGPVRRGKIVSHGGIIETDYIC